MTRRCCYFYVPLCCFHHSWVFTLLLLLLLLLHYFPLAKHERRDRSKAPCCFAPLDLHAIVSFISPFYFFSSSSITLLLFPFLVYIYPHSPTNPRQALSLRFLQKDHATQIRHNRHTVIPPPKAASFPPPLLISASFMFSTSSSSKPNTAHSLRMLPNLPIPPF